MQGISAHQGRDIRKIRVVVESESLGEIWDSVESTGRLCMVCPCSLLLPWRLGPVQKPAWSISCLQLQVLGWHERAAEQHSIAQSAWHTPPLTHVSTAMSHQRQGATKRSDSCERCGLSEGCTHSRNTCPHIKPGKIREVQQGSNANLGRPPSTQRLYSMC
jgi:hypothetical protein